MVAGADRELRQRFSRARPLGPRQLEEVARQRRQAHAVVQAPQRPARARFLHRRRIHGPDLERASGDDRQTLLLEQADTQRVQPTPWISSAASTAPRRTGPPDAPAGPEPPFPATSVRSRGAAGGSAGGCRPSCPCAAPSTPRCPAPTRASPEGRTTPAHPSPRPPCRPPCHASTCQDTPAMSRKQVSAYGVESRPPLRPTGVFLAVVRRRDRHRRAPGGANVDGLQAVAPHPPGQVAHEGARRVANRGGAHRALQHGGEEGAEELVRDGPQLLFALLRFLCRPGRWSTRLKLQRPPEGSAQVDGNVAKIDLAARGVDGALVHFNAPSWAVRAVMSSTTLPVCPKTGSTSPSLTGHLCLHTVPGNRECARLKADARPSPANE